jgi:hypothetical protein
MMGDNRDASLDARFFGFVPETHIVGSPMFTWMSLQGVFDDGPKKSVGKECSKQLIQAKQTKHRIGGLLQQFLYYSSVGNIL